MPTIIIPSYNQAEFLPDAIESALNQKNPAEVIVIDDGSTDNSLEIARSYVPQIKLISQVNKGLSSARNTGIMNATTDWILPLDADDVLDLNCVSVLMAKAMITGADIIAPSFKTFGVVSSEVTIMENPTLSDFRTGNRIGYFSLMRKTMLLDVGGYSSRMTWGAEDYHLWFNLLTRGYKLVTVPNHLVLYRTKHGSMWSETQKHQAEYMAQIFKDFPQVL